MFYFIDSNIWFYSITETDNSEKTIKAKSIIKDNEEKIILSIQVINEVCVNLIKKAGISENDIQELILDFQKKYKVCNIDIKILLKACKLRTNK